jgi:hypothetical protein
VDNRELNIINRFLHGDHEAYSLLYREHIQELFSYGKALTGNDERLKEVFAKRDRAAHQMYFINYYPTLPH